jgi:hypothetical protein
MDFGHPHNTCIGERHRPVPIFLMKLAQGGDMLADVKCDREGTIFEKAEQCILRPADASAQLTPAHIREAGRPAPRFARLPSGEVDEFRQRLARSAVRLLML